MERYDAIVVGAGPYGLSAAAHLIKRKLKIAVFGKPLQLWREYMPEGMFLRSQWWATNLSDPDGRYSFTKFFAASRYTPAYPVPIRTFIDYGMWFQRHAVPNVDETFVSSIEREGARFRVELADGRAVSSAAVVLAVGLKHYANVPHRYTTLPADRCTHTFEESRFQRFSGKTVAMIGAGQSAVEYSALLREAGAQVHLIARRPIRWLPPDRDAERGFLERIHSPRAGIAPGWVNWSLEAFPYLFQRLPQPAKDYYTETHYQAAANDWLRDRVFGKVALHEGRHVEEVRAEGSGVRLKLSDHQKLDVDHVMLGTGYRVNLDRLPMLSDTLKVEIRTDSCAPVLDPWFETSVPGLHLLGLTSVKSFGPLYRFVVGAKAAAPRVASAVARRVRALSH